MWMVDSGVLRLPAAAQVCRGTRGADGRPRRGHRLTCDRATCWAGTAHGSVVAAGLQSPSAQFRSAGGVYGASPGERWPFQLEPRPAWLLPFPAMVRPVARPWPLGRGLVACKILLPRGGIRQVGPGDPASAPPSQPDPRPAGPPAARPALGIGARWGCALRRVRVFSCSRLPRVSQVAPQSSRRGCRSQCSCYSHFADERSAARERGGHLTFDPPPGRGACQPAFRTSAGPVSSVGG